MRSSIKIFLAASVTVAALGVAGCGNSEKVPDASAPGGVLSGSDYDRIRAASRSQYDQNALRSNNTAPGSPQTAGPSGTGGTATSGELSPTARTPAAARPDARARAAGSSEPAGRGGSGAADCFRGAGARQWTAAVAAASPERSDRRVDAVPARGKSERADVDPRPNRGRPYQ